MAKMKRYPNVAEMVRDTAEKGFADALEKRLAGRQLVKRLLLMRASQDISQEQIAEKLNCSQSRISKLEMSNDAEIRLGDLMKYTNAIGMQAQILLSKKGTTLVDEVKYHFFQTKKLLERMVALTGGDPSIEKGLAKFFSEATFNYMKMIFEHASKLPETAHEEMPFLKMISEQDDPSDCSEVASSDPLKELTALA